MREAVVSVSVEWKKWDALKNDMWKVLCNLEDGVKEKENEKVEGNFRLQLVLSRKFRAGRGSFERYSQAR